MQDFSTVLIGGLQRLGMATLLIAVYADLFHRLREHDRLRRACTGLLFGLGAVLAMISPMTISPGIVVDPRHVLLGLSGAFGGWPAAAIAAAIASGCRIGLGGIGALAGVLGIGAAALAGLAFRRQALRSAGLSLPSLIGLGALSSSALLTGCLLPSPLGWTFLIESVPAMAVATACGVVVLGGMLTRAQRGLMAEAALREAATLDSLTGLYNRRVFRERLDAKVESAHGTGRGVAVLMIDLDRFKQLNDECGHHVGDAALAGVGAILQEVAGPSDFAARLGGDEFCIALMTPDLQAAKRRAEIIRVAVQSLGADSPLASVSLTASIGLAWLEPAMGAHELLRRADEALYGSKRDGRNRVSASPPKLSLVA